MISVKIGKKGRLGNQMFQYAALIGIAQKQGLNHGINYKKGNDLTWKEYGIDNEYKLLTLDKAFNLSAPQYESNKLDKVIKEKYFHFDEVLFNTGDDAILEGYFQTDKYFNHCEDIIKKEFSFKKEIIDACNFFLNDKSFNETVSIHVRRGDYINNSYYAQSDILYYEKAILKNFNDKDYNFIVITDDIDWCKLFFNKKNFYISEGCNQFLDMCIMSMCNHNIITNSSFSWWGSWLNKNLNKKIIAPAQWFTNPEILTKDLYSSNWITL